MKALAIIAGVLLVLFMFVVAPLIGSYNNLVQQDVAVDKAWSDVETQYQRRFDLIPGLVGAVKGILTQEQEVFGAIAEARTRYANAKESGTQEEQVEAYGQYESVVGRLLMVMENYPELKSNEQVTALMDELAGTENRVAVSRTRYNESVQGYDLTISRFPTNIIAGIFNFDERPYFKSDEAASTAPVVDLTTE